MADNQQLYGLRFHSTRSGSAQMQPRPYRVASAYAGQPDGANTCDIHIGDVVKLAADGVVQFAAVGDATLLGVVVGVGQYWDGTFLQCLPSVPSGATYGTNYARETRVLVQTFYDSIFEIDCDDAVTATTYAAYLPFIGENADLSVTVNTATKRAHYRLDISDHKTATAQMRILDISPRQQDFSGNYVKLLVAANETSTSLVGYASGAAGV